MAYLLSGERPAVAALSDNLVGIQRWLRGARAARTQRLALKALLEFDEHRLDDLGISRQDVVEALAHRQAKPLAMQRAQRAQRAKAWFDSL